tara:strand:+ start:3243 stop:3485 length:243 start_codon:yes stop_codon:yes gene_type:complete
MKLKDLEVGHLYRWQYDYPQAPVGHWIILEELPRDSRSTNSVAGTPHRRFRWYCIHGNALNDSMIFDMPESQVYNLTLIS